MNSRNHIPSAVSKSIHNLIGQLPPLTERKSPAVAAVLGFFTGGIGLGLYFQDWTDFLVPLFIILLLAISSLLTGGVLLPAIPLFLAYYGFRRASTSNEKLRGWASHSKIIEAEVVGEPPPIPAIQRAATDSRRPLELRLRKLDDLLREGILSKSKHDEQRAHLLSEL